MASLGNLVVKIKADATGFTIGIDQAEKQTKSFGKSASALGGILKASIIPALIAGAAAAIKGAADFEKQQIAFETMLGSADKAKVLLDQITQFAATTPFQLPGLIEGSKRLLAFGTSEEEIIPIMTNLGNAAQGNQEILDRLTLAYGKLKAKGRASLEELNMFTEAGVPILQALSDEYGVTTQEMFKLINNGRVGFDDVNQALTNLTTGSGKFAGLIEKQSQSLAGLFSTLGDNIGLLAKDLGTQLLPTIKEIVTSATGIVQGLEPLAVTVGKALGEIFKIVVDVIEKIQPIFDILATGLDQLLPAISELFDALSPIIDIIIDLTKIILPPLIAITTSVIKIISGLINIISPLASVISNLIKGPLNLLGGAVKGVYNFFGNLVSSVGKAVKSLTGAGKAAAAASLKTAQLHADYEILSKKTNLTAAEQTKLNAVIRELAKTLPDATVVVNEETGALKLNSEELNNQILARKRLLVAVASVAVSVIRSTTLFVGELTSVLGVTTKQIDKFTTDSISIIDKFLEKQGLAREEIKKTGIEIDKVDKKQIESADGSLVKTQEEIDRKKELLALEEEISQFNEDFTQSAIDMTQEIRDREAQILQDREKNYTSMLNNIQSISGSAFESIGQAIIDSGDGWAIFKDAAKQAFVAVLRGLAQIATVQAAIAFAAPFGMGIGKGIALLAASAAASVAAGVVASLKDGGLVMPRSGGTPVIMAEGGYPEYAVPDRSDVMSRLADRITYNMRRPTQNIFNPINNINMDGIMVSIDGQPMRAWISKESRYGRIAIDAARGVTAR